MKQAWGKEGKKQRKKETNRQMEIKNKYLEHKNKQKDLK